MSIDSNQLNSFYFYKYFIKPLKVPDFSSSSRSDAADETIEQQLNAKVAEGDSAFGAQGFSKALELYLEAYGLVHRILHPDFPVNAVIKNPRILADLDIFEALIKATIQIARFRDRAGSLPLVVVEDLPPRFSSVVNKFTVGSRAPMRSSQLAYQAATSYLRMGEATEAQRFLDLAKKLDKGQDPVLRAHILSSTAVAQTLNLDRDAAQKSLTLARQQYKDLGMFISESAMNKNINVLSNQFNNVYVPRDVTISSVSSLSEKDHYSQESSMISESLNLLVPDHRSEMFEVSATASDQSIRTDSFRVQVGDEVKQVGLTENAEAHLLDLVYKPRINARDLSQLHPHLESPYNFLAHIPHLYGFVLPMDMGDCYAALGRRPDAIESYFKVLKYRYLNRIIEAPHLWLKIARTIVDEADHHFQKGDPSTAKSWYEKVLLTNNTLPLKSQLYKGAYFKPMIEVVQSAILAFESGKEFSGNYEIGSLIADISSKLIKIDAGLNWLGQSEEAIPIWSFEYLQSVARYFAQQSIQAWRDYINFTSAAEQGKITERELDQAVKLSEIALSTQTEQLMQAAYQSDVANKLKESAANHIQNLKDSKESFAAFGGIIDDMDRRIALLNNLLNNPTYGLIDIFISSRNVISQNMQLENFERQIEEAQDQERVAEAQINVALAQFKVAVLEQAAGILRFSYAKSNLEFFRNREFTPDMMYALASQMREQAKLSLQRGISVAFLMEKAFQVENDIDLPSKIRFDYSSPQTGELTAGDYLLQDIDSFTFDLLMLSKGRRDRVRHVISLADFAPYAFNRFVRTGTMEFTIPLWVLERAYPGTYLQRIQSVEVEIEGLQVPEGINGRLTHLGISSWRRSDGSVRSRVTAPETMILSGFKLRRDLALYRPDSSRLGLFENSSPAASWRLEVPPSTNDVDFTTISDVRLVLYFYCLHDSLLESEIRATFPTSGEAAQFFSARLHAPDEYFALGPKPNGSNRITFNLDPRTFPCNHLNIQSSEIEILVLRYSDDGGAAPFLGVPIIVRMANHTGSGITDSRGSLASNQGASPLAVLINQPITDIEVEFAGPSDDLSKVADVFLLLTYRFDYR